MTATTPKFRIDVTINDLLTTANRRSPVPAENKGLTLPTPVFPQYPEHLYDPGPEAPPDKRRWGLDTLMRMQSAYDIWRQRGAEVIRIAPQHLNRPRKQAEPAIRRASRPSRLSLSR